MHPPQDGRGRRCGGYAWSTMRATLLVVPVALVATPSCRGRGDAETRRDAAPEGQTSDGGAARLPGVASSAPIDALGTIYPRDAPPHPLATRLCEALHAVPARRKAECCGGEPAPLLMAECTRVLGATLHAGTVDLQESAVERCAAAMTDARKGCDWVTPSAPPVPEPCQRLLRGKLERGSVCRSSLECAGDLHCAGVSPTKTGVCTPPGGTGAGCGAHVDVLATYLFDRQLATSHPFCAEHCAFVTHKCGPPPDVGAACVADVNCAASQLCIQGRCSAADRGHRGDPCSVVPCAEGLRCVDAVCAPLATPGEACRSDMDCAAGACVREVDGAAKCGAQCSMPLDALRSRDGGPVMGLPRKPHANDRR